MEVKVIIASVVKSSKSDNKVWAVAITGEEQPTAYCKSASKAMRFAFLLKKRTGYYISDNCLSRLSHEIASLKAEKPAEATEPAPSIPVEVLEFTAEEPKPAPKKRGRKPKAKTAEAVAA